MKRLVPLLMLGALLLLGLAIIWVLDEGEPPSGAETPPEMAAEADPPPAERRSGISKLSGQVLGPEGPVAGARLSLFFLKAPGAAQPFVDELEQTTDPEGRFSVEIIAPKTVQILAEAEGLAMGQSREMELVGDEQIDDVKIVLELAQELRQAPGPRLMVRRRGDDEPESPLGGLKGRVLADGLGTPVYRFQVRLMSFRGTAQDAARLPTRSLRSFAGSDGRFVMDKLEPGHYSLQVFTQGWTPARLPDVDVEAGRVTDLGDLFLKGPGGVRGRVVDAVSGEPLADVNVGAMGAGGRSIRGRSSGDGRFFLPSLPADLVSVGFAKQGYVRELVSGLKVRSGETLDMGEVALEPSEGKGGDFAYAGMGASLREKDGRLVVGEVFEGAPASQVGLVEGSQILRVDDQDVGVLGLRGAVERIRGREGSMVTLEVLFPGESSPRKVHIQRGRVISPPRRRP